MEKPKNPGGRPPGRKLTERINVYLEPEDVQQAQALAARRGVPVSTLLRLLIQEAAKREKVG
jgi:hypothetical protein